MLLHFSLSLLPEDYPIELQNGDMMPLASRDFMY
jgi:hypothetical protein